MVMLAKLKLVTMILVKDVPLAVNDVMQSGDAYIHESMLASRSNFDDQGTRWITVGTHRGVACRSSQFEI